MLHTLTVATRTREQLVDITEQIRDVVRRSGIRDGLAVVFSTHTTAGITINENADPDVPRDLLHWLSTRIPADGEFRHAEGNSDAHLKTSFFGASQTLIIDKGELALGTWQGVFLAEFDGPRQRQVLVKLMPTA